MKFPWRARYLIILISVFLFQGFSGFFPDKATAQTYRLPRLDLIAVYDLDIVDPSGLTLDRSGAFLWTVSDTRGGAVYAISFSGEIISELIYEGHDLEGITQDPSDGSLWLAEERLREIVRVDRRGEELERHSIDISMAELNTGLEGIAFHPGRNILFLANEMLPRVIMEVDTEGNILHTEEINFLPPFRMIDLSGLWYDPERDELWILSDESAKIVVVDSEYRPLRGYQLDRIKFEGIAVDYRRQRIYLVHDVENRLYVYHLPVINSN
ncbi:SdiA-regulated domain-containing protein [Spirochaeta dissipatitropha]